MEHYISKPLICMYVVVMHGILIQPDHAFDNDRNYNRHSFIASNYVFITTDDTQQSSIQQRRQ